MYGSPRRATTSPSWPRSAPSWTWPATPAPRAPGSSPTAARRLGTAAEHANALGVRILLEPHDSHRTAADAMRILGLVGHRQVGALWDVMHTWLGGEQPSETYAALSPHLGYVQVKDIATADNTTPIALGAVVMPLAGGGE